MHTLDSLVSRNTDAADNIIVCALIVTSTDASVWQTFSQIQPTNTSLKCESQLVVVIAIQQHLLEIYQLTHCKT